MTTNAVPNPGSEEAADTITRLEAEVAKGASILRAWQARAAKAGAENERLRAALEEIKALEGEINPGNYTHEDVVKLNDAFIVAFQIATAALSQEKPNADS